MNAPYDDGPLLEALIKKYPFGARLPAHINLYSFPVHEAVKKNHPNQLRVLAKASVNLDEIDSDTYAPIHYAAMRSNAAMVSLLLKLGANPNRTAEFSLTALHIACKKGDADVVKALLESDELKIDLPDYDSFTGLLFAVCHSKYDCARVLLDAGASSRRKCGEGWDSLEWACQRSDQEMISIIHEARNKESIY